MNTHWRRRGGGIAPALTLMVGLLLLAPQLAAPVTAEESEEQAISGAMYVGETGFWVDARFAGYWKANGGLMTFGYPLTRVFYQDGFHRQYFERAIFERHEDAGSSPWATQLVRLGALNTIERRRVEEPFQPLQPRPIRERGENPLFFSETGHFLNETFRGYWESHGGAQSFGYPLSEAFVEPGLEDGEPRLVQYFERARFEHHPEHGGTEFEVLLGHLGREALAAREVPPIALRPQARSAAERDSPPIGPLPVGEPGVVGCGFNVNWHADPTEEPMNVYYLDLAAESGCEWLRFQFAWRDLQPQKDTPIEERIWPFARVVELARQRGLRLLVDVTHPPAWARPADPTLPADPDAFGAFMGQLAGRFAGQVEAWQVWNEPNLIDENNGRIDPYGFFLLLRAAYPAIKAADPDALVVFPGLAPTSLMYDDWALDDDWYLEAILTINGGEAANYFDVLGVQGYGAGNPPDTYFPGNLADNPGWTESPEFYFRHIEQLRAVMVNAGQADKPVWITEMGWPVGVRAPVYGYGEWVTPALQAAYLTRAYEIIRTEWQWVKMSMVWHLNTAAFVDNGSGFSSFSITESSGEPRPAYEAIADMIAAWRGEATP